MANITVTANTPVVSVTSTPTSISVTDGSGINQTITTTKSNVTVSSSQSNVTVGGLAAVANGVIRSAISATDAGGDGSFTYNQTTGVFTYTGPSASEVRAHFSNTSPITYNSSTGVIGVDSGALFTGKTTDDLPQGTTNKYFTTTGAAINTDNLTEGSTNLYFTTPRADAYLATKTTSDLAEGSNLYYTDSRSRAALSVNQVTPSGDGSLSYSSVAGVFTFTPANVPNNTNELSEGSTNLYYTNARVLAYVVDAGLDFNAEKVDDQVANLLVAGNSIDITYNDSANTLTIDYQEDVVSNGNIFANVSFDIDSGTIHKASLIGNVTGITFANITAGDSATLVFTQDLTGYRYLDTTTYPSNWTNWEFSDNSSALSLDPSALDVISVFYDGVKYYASIVTMEDSAIPNSSLSNSNVIINGTTFTLGTSGTLNTFNTDVTINGNLEVAGNLDYVNVQDLLVNDQSITLNYGNATARDAFVYVDRSGSTLNNAHIKWNETGDQWEIYDGTTTYKIPTSTDDLAEGVSNLYYTDSRFDTRFATKTTDNLTEGSTNLYFSNTNLATSSTTHLPEGTNLYYTDARANSAFDARLIDTGVTKKAHTVFVQDLALSPDAANAQLGFYMPNGQGTAGQVLKFDSATQLTQAFIDTGNVTETTNLFYTTARANSAIDAYVTGGNAITVASGVVSLDNTAVTPKTYGDATNVAQITVDQQGRITGVSNVAISGGAGTYGNANVQNFLENGYSAANINANDIVAVTFTGDGSDLTSVRAETIEITIKNADTVTIPKGYPVHAIGTGPGGEANVVLADAGNADLMPAHFIALEELTNPGDTGRGLLSGLITGVDTSSFIAGDVIYVAVGGGYANTAPSGEANLIQNLGVVTDVAVSGKGEVYGSGRAAATPNLNNGNIFIGNGSNQAVSAVLDTSIVPENTNLYYTDARVQSNTAADTGLVHTTGDESIAGTKTFTNVIKSIPASSTDGLIIENDISSTPFLFTSNVQGTNPLTAQPGVRMRWQQSADGELGGTIEARKTRGNVAVNSATEFGDQIFNFKVLPFTNGTFKEGVRLGFDVEHTSATSGAGGGAVTTIFDNAEYGKDFTTTKLLHTSTGSFKIGPGAVDINPTQFRNRGNTIIGNGGDTNYISVADTEAKLIFDKSNVSSTSNVALRIEGTASQYVWVAFNGYNIGSYGWGLDQANVSQYDAVTIIVDGATEYNGGIVEAGKLPDGMPITIGGTTRAEGTTFFNAFLTNAEGNTYYIKKFHNDAPGIGSGNSNKVVYALFNDAALTSPLRYSVLDASAWGPPGGAGYYVGYANPYYPGVYNGGGHIKYSTKPAQGNVFVNSGSWTTTGSGANSKFVVNRWEGSYNTINFETPTFGYGGSFAPAEGDGHAVGDTITIDGANLKGISGTNNLTFTIDSIDGSGGVLTIGNITGTAYQITDQEWSFEMDQTTDNLYVKDDGVTKFTFTPNGVALKQFNETVVALGNQSGNVSANIDAVNGSIFTMTAVGNVTINTIPNAQAGSSYTLKITQDGTGSRLLTSSMKYLGGNATLSTGAGNIDVISVVYDGTDYLASLSHDYK